MQNFTLGKKGHSMLLFVLVLLIGSLPSFGQTCPEPGDFPASQTFCYLQTIEDLDTDGFPVFQTSDTEGDTQPIPRKELLTAGAVYFVNSSTGDCRSPLTVTVNNAPRPANRITNSIVSGFEFTTCTPASFNSTSLADLFVAQANYRIEVYGSESSTAPLVGAALSTGESYFVGQVPTADAAPGSCPSFRVAVGFNPNQIEAPIAETPQIFCENATVADLVAQGTYDDTQAIRWYRSQTANSPLSDNTQLINGQTYFAAQVVNERGSITPPCETPAGDRAPVFVELNDPIVINTPAPGIVCETDVQATFPSEDAIRNFYLNLLEAGVPRNGNFSPNAGQIAQMYQNDADGLGDFTTTYSVGEGSCESSVDLTITVVPTEDANAGSIEDITLPCGSTDVVVLDDTLLSDNATTGGTFSGTGVNADGNFDPTTVSAGTYTITYSVDDSANCVTPGTSASTTFDIIVGDGTGANGGSFTGIVCEDDVQTLFPSNDEVRKYLRALLGSNVAGTFNPTVDQLVDMYQADADGLGDFTTIFTPTNGTCNSAVELTISVVPTEDAEAGTIEDITLPCGSTDVVVLDDTILSDNATTGGTFSGTGVNADGNFDPTTVSAGTYTITYSVDDSANCVTPGTSASTTFDIIVGDGTGANGGSFTGIVCEDDVQTLFPSNDEVRKYLRALLGSNVAGTFNPTVDQLVDMYQADADGLGDFTTIFTPTNGTCNSAVELTISVVPTEDAEAGTIEDITLPCGSTDVVVLDDTLLSDNATTGGTFSGTGVNADGNFDPTTVSAGTYTITYSVDDSANCVTPGTSASTTFDIIVGDGTGANGGSFTGVVCEDDVQTLFPSNDEVRKYLRALLGSNVAGTFNPTVAQLVDMYQADADGLGDFTTIFTPTNGTCNSAVELTISVVPTEDAEAGTIEDITLPCGSTDVVVLDDTILSDNATTGGTFSGTGVNADGNFDPTTVSAGTYTITYSVDDSANCVTPGTSASTTFDIIVGDGTDLGAPIVLERCITEIEGFLGNPTAAIALYNDALTERGITDFTGTFTPSLQIVGVQILTYLANEDRAQSATFVTNYSITNSCGVSSLPITLTINNTTTAEAGTIEDITLPCGSTDVVVLDDTILSDNATTGGTFSGTGVNADGNFDPTTVSAGTYTITYSVDDSANCVTPGTTSSTTFDIIVGDGTFGESFTGVVCEDDVQTLFPSNDEVRKYLRALLGSNVAGTFNPTVAQLVDMYQADADGLGDFTTIFTPTNGTCNSAVELTISVVPTEDAEAGTIEDITLPCGSTDVVVLDDTILSDNASTGGTFSGTGVNADGNFDPTTVSAGTYTITYSVDDSANCVTPGTTSSTTFDIIVGDGTFGESFTGVVCEDDVQTLFPSNDEVRKYLRALLGSNVAGTFNPTVDQLVDMYQADADGLGDFTTIFTPTNGTCNSAVELTISVVPTEDAEAGTIEDITLSCGSTDVVVLDDTILSDNATTGGTFSGTGVNADGNFDPTTVSAGTYTITYSVDDSANCVTPGTTSSTTFDIIVGDGTFGESFTGVVCEDDVQTLFPSNDEVRKYLRALLGSNVAGTFNPTVDQLVDMYQADADGLGDFTTIFTPTNGTCNSAVELTISVVPTEDAEAGTIEDITLSCGSTDVVVLDDTILSDNASTGGTFSGTGVNADGNFDPTTVSAGTYTITYSVDDSANCVTPGTISSTTFDIIVGDGTDLGAPIVLERCITEIEGFLGNPAAAIALYNDALTERGITDFTGTFTPSLQIVGVQILTYLANEDRAQSATFVTNYSITNSCGVSSLPITLTINNTTTAEAGSIEDATACTSQETLDLFSLLSDSNIAGGTFSNENGVISNGVFDVSTAGEFNITYTVTGNDPSTCVTGTDSTEFTVSVSEGDANAGADNSIEVCQDQVDNFSSAEVRSFYLGLLDEGVNTNGTFNPTINQIIAQYQQNKIADFTTVYTVENGACTDSATLTITVTESIVANAGENVNLTFCSIEESVNLADYLSEGVDLTGAFEGFEDGMFNPANNIGTTTFTYTVDNTIDEDACTTGTDTVSFTITVNELQDANAGGNVTATYCVGQEENIDLISLLGEDALTTGTFDAPYESGVFNLVDSEVGVYVVSYTVDGEGNCAIGTDTATITITINNGPDAPVANANQSFCLIDNPTVGDIVVTGDNVVIYTDANLTNAADATTTLVSGMSYYATSTTDDAACSSEATIITVTITDPSAPTLTMDGDEFCRSDNPTIQALVNNFSGSGIVIYSSSTGGTAIAATTPLQDGVTYYGASLDGTTGCESSERIAVVAKVEFCGIPEGFSPNGDGKNDQFVIPDIATLYPNYTIEVFNRWGNVVFKGNASTGDWDGISNQSGTLGDDVLPVGVYFYILNYNDGQTAPVQGKLYLSI